MKICEICGQNALALVPPGGISRETGNRVEDTRTKATLTLFAPGTDAPKVLLFSCSLALLSFALEPRLRPEICGHL